MNGTIMSVIARRYDPNSYDYAIQDLIARKDLYLNGTLVTEEKQPVDVGDLIKIECFTPFRVTADDLIMPGKP